MLVVNIVAGKPRDCKPSCKDLDTLVVCVDGTPKEQSCPTGSHCQPNIWVPNDAICIPDGAVQK